MKNLLQLIFALIFLAGIQSCQEPTSTQKEQRVVKTLPNDLLNMEVPHFITRDSLLNPLKRQIVETYQQLAYPNPISQEITGSWSFVLGKPQNGLKVAINAKPRSGSVSTNLPHEVMKPNWPMWYSRSIKITEPSLLNVNADDGAQVFQDGKLLNPVNGNYFPLQVTSDSSRIDIRVLNNAMAGGLRRVGIITEQDFGYQQKVRVIKLFNEKLVRQAIDGPPLSSSRANEIIAVIQNKSRDAQQNIERYYAPILIDPFLQKAGFSEYAIMYERSTRTSTRLDWIDVQRNIPNRFLCENRNELTCEVRTDLLEAGIPYDVEVSDNRSKSKFRMQAPTNKLKYSFSAWGDSQSGWTTFRSLVDQMAQTQDNFTIGLGDLVADGSKKEEWVNFFSCLAPISRTTPLFMVAGNHDYDGFYNDLIPFSLLSYIRNSNRNRTFYSWRAPYAAFIVLDPNRNFPLGIDQEQGAWLEKELASNDWQTAQWRFILIHQPPYSQGWPGYHGDEFIKNIIDNIAENAKVDFVLSGHSHDYERLTKKYGNQETTFLVMGGAGGNLEPKESSDFPKMDVLIKEHHFGRFFLEDKKIRLEVYNLEGKVIDQFERNR